MPVPVQPNQVGPNPVTQPQGVPFTNATVPKPVEERYIPDNEIVARPLTTPDFINMQPKNKNMKFRWGNRSVGDKESRLRINELIARGFRPAKPEDVEGWDKDPEKSKVPDSLVINGQILYGDLMLLIISRQAYDGAIKYNEQTAKMRVQKRGDNPEQETLLKKAAHGKVTFYEPPSGDTEKALRDNENAPKMK